jgi:hypothetical protein
LNDLALYFSGSNSSLQVKEGRGIMNKNITLLAGIMIFLFFILPGCVGFVGYVDYDYPHGHYYYGGPYHHGYHH